MPTPNQPNPRGSQGATAAEQKSREQLAEEQRTHSRVEGSSRATMPADPAAHSGVVLNRPPEAGGPITAASLAGLLSAFNAACKARDFHKAQEQAGFLMIDVSQVMAEKGTTAGAAPAPAGAARQQPAGLSELQAAVRDFDEVKADVISFAPEVHRVEWHRAGGPTTGAAPPMGAQMGPRLTPENLMNLLETVSQLIATVRLFF